MEKFPASSQEKILSPEKQLLHELESTGQYVFHGSGSDIEELEPRQAHNFTPEGKIPDGEPAIFASDIADYAIFMAIINKENCLKGARSRVNTHHTNEGRSLSYSVTQETFNQLTDTAHGIVYVFNKEDFVQRDPLDTVEYISTKNARPVQKIVVSKQDLPGDIGLIASPEAPRV